MIDQIQIPFRIPGHLHFSWQDKAQSILGVDADVKKGDTGLRQIDSWMLAVVAAQEEGGKNGRVKGVQVNLKGRPEESVRNSFVRRLSYHALNLGWDTHLKIEGGAVDLCRSTAELLKPRAGEVIHKNWSSRSDNPDRDGSIEKMLQTWLAGSARGSGHRLAIFGDDFVFGPKRSPAKVAREIPTGVFDGTIKEGNRILPTYWVDLVTLNRAGHLAVIELKVNDNKLDILAQALDYALFFKTYWAQLASSPKLDFAKGKKGPIEVYLASNVFHPQFDSAAGYLSPRGSGWGFEFKKIALGVISEL